MDNQSFRQLILNAPSISHPPRKSTIPPSSSLGSRATPSIPMTPRTVKGRPTPDFARQLAAQNPNKKFRSTSAPKGSKLAPGFRDRTLDRIGDEDEEADDRARRIKALEESMKLGQISRAEFEELRDQITGGDIRATHLVKGLDRKLLERVRCGEDVMGSALTMEKTSGLEDQVAADEELNKLEAAPVAPLPKENKKIKKGTLAQKPPVAGIKRSRDAILAELKASRQAAAKAKAGTAPQLSSRFKRIGEEKEKPRERIEIDEKGREVLITVDEEGNLRRKVKKKGKGKRDLDDWQKSGLLMPDKNAKPLGMEVPDLAPVQENIEDDDIFDGVGSNYNPLAEEEEEDDDNK